MIRFNVISNINSKNLEYVEELEVALDKVLVRQIYIVNDSRCKSHSLRMQLMTSPGRKAYILRIPDRVVEINIAT